jgi:hypothetical protein
MNKIIYSLAILLCCAACSFAASKKVSELPTATSLGDADTLFIVQGGVSKKITGATMLSTIGETVVHRTGDEIIAGVKTFSGTVTAANLIPYTGATADIDLGEHSAIAKYTKLTASIDNLICDHNSVGTFRNYNYSSNDSRPEVCSKNPDNTYSWKVFADAVPYTGAANDVNLGSHNLATTGKVLVGLGSDDGKNKLQVFGTTALSGHVTIDGYVHLQPQTKEACTSLMVGRVLYEEGVFSEQDPHANHDRVYVCAKNDDNSYTWKDVLFNIPYTGATTDVNLNNRNLTTSGGTITAGNLVANTSVTAPNLVPYTGATSDVNLGTHGLHTSGTIGAYGFSASQASTFPTVVSETIQCPLPGWDALNIIGSPVNITGDVIVSSGSVKAPQFKLSALNTAPSSATATGTLGEIRVDANYIYICTATNTWKRSALSSW